MAIDFAVPICNGDGLSRRPCRRQRKQELEFTSTRLVSANECLTRDRYMRQPCRYTLGSSNREERRMSTFNIILQNMCVFMCVRKAIKGEELHSRWCQESIGPYRQRRRSRREQHKVSMRRRTRSKRWCRLSQCELRPTAFRRPDSNASSRHSFFWLELSELSHDLRHVTRFVSSSKLSWTWEERMRMWR